MGQSHLSGGMIIADETAADPQQRCWANEAHISAYITKVAVPVSFGDYDRFAQLCECQRPQREADPEERSPSFLEIIASNPCEYISICLLESPRHIQ